MITVKSYTLLFTEIYEKRHWSSREDTIGHLGKTRSVSRPRDTDAPSLIL